MDWISFSLGMAAGGFSVWLIIIIRVRTTTKKLMKTFASMGKGDKPDATT